MNEWVWSNGGMILTGENWSTERKTLYSVGGRWMNEYGAMVVWYWQGKSEVLGEKHYTAWVVDEWMSMEQWWNDTNRGNGSTWRKRCSHLTLSTTYPTGSGLGPNLGHHFERPVGDPGALTQPHQKLVYLMEWTVPAILIYLPTYF